METQPTASSTSPITFKDRALACIKHGFSYVIPLRAESKIPPSTLPDWPNLATTSLGQIELWNQQNPNFNCGVVFKAAPGAQWALEVDSPHLAKRYEEETGKKLPKTLTVQSRVGRGHRFYAHTAASMAMGNIGQEDADGFSVRCNNAYCVSMLSVHPETKTLYEIVVDTPIVPAPDDFVEWLTKQRKAKTPTGEHSTTWLDDPIREGSRDNTLTKIAGALRRVGLSEEEMYTVLSIKNQRQCVATDGITPFPMEDAAIQRIAKSIARKDPAPPEQICYLGGVQLTGPGAEVVRAAVQQSTQADASKWEDYFKSVGELDAGEIQMLVTGFLPEGITFIGGLPGEGKTLLGLSIAAALTTGRKFLGRFTVPAIVPCLYLIPESSGRAFRKRCEAFNIPDDRDLFLCRTISEGSTLLLADPILKEAVRSMKPVVFLDTAIRFSQAADENSASQNKRLADDMISLRQAGAIAVVPLHHATKASRTEEMTLENVLRGTGDTAALADCVYGLKRDDVLYAQNQGPNEIEVKCVKPRDFDPPAPFRIAATYKKHGCIFPVSWIDETGDFKIVEVAESLHRYDNELVRLVQDFPSITLEDLAKEIGSKKWKVQKILQSHGWFKPKGGAKGGGKWMHESDNFSAEKTAPKSPELPIVPQGQSTFPGIMESLQAAS